MFQLQFHLSGFRFQFPGFGLQVTVSRLPVSFSGFQVSGPAGARQKSFSSVQLQDGIQFPVFSFQLGAESARCGTDSVRPPSVYSETPSGLFLKNTAVSGNTLIDSKNAPGWRAAIIARVTPKKRKNKTEQFRGHESSIPRFFSLPACITAGGLFGIYPLGVET